MKGILEVQKFDKGAQVEIISSAMNGKMSKFDKKILAQHRLEQRLLKKKAGSSKIGPCKSMSILEGESPKLDLLPTFDNKPRLDALDNNFSHQASTKSPQ